MANPFDQFDAAPGGPLMGPAPKPTPAPAPKTTYRVLSPEEATQRGLPAGGVYQESSEGNVTTISQPEKATAGATNDRINDARTLRSLIDEYERVAGPYMDTTTPGEVVAQVNPFERLNTQGIRARETTAQNILPLIRRIMRTPGDPQAQLETSAYDTFLPSINVTDEENRRRVQVLRDLANQIDPEGVAAPAAPAPQDDREPTVAAAPPGAAPPSDPGNPSPMPLSPGDPAYTAATGGTRTVNDPAMAAIADEYRSRLASGQRAGEIIPWLRSKGVSNQTLVQAMKQIQYRQQNPDVPIDRYSITSQVEVPLSAAEQVITDLGSGGAGAYAIGAGQFLSGNTLDNLASDPERARLAMAVSEAQNPGATFAGQMTGGILAGLTGEAGLARLGMAAGLGRGVAADTLAGAAQGAGMADDGNRLAGAGQGAVAQGLGSLLGGGAMQAVGRALNQTGGNLADLYAAGVRPTPGQRFGNSNIVGRAVNATEEALQSVPVVGTAISGARQQARDQFQVGAFNEALREIGDTLPAGMRPGTDPHRYTQEAFRRVYDTARSGMKLVADEQLANDLSGLAPDIEALGPAAQNKLRTIISNTVRDDLSGDAYKRSMSDLGKHSARLRRSAMGDDQLMADILDGVSQSLDSAARRHSDPEAVALLDAADAGYAKLVRIEQASARRGGDDGTFTPTGFDSAVQNASGGVRSKAYLRGDALMQDYANAGKNLVDRMPNSGTADRAMAATTIAGGAAYLEPTTLGILGAIGAAYAPGVRRATTGAFAPSKGKRKAISQALRKIERLGGATSGALALQGTSPAP